MIFRALMIGVYWGWTIAHWATLVLLGSVILSAHPRIRKQCSWIAIGAAIYILAVVLYSSLIEDWLFVPGAHWWSRSLWFVLIVGAASLVLKAAGPVAVDVVFSMLNGDWLTVFLYIFAALAVGITAWLLRLSAEVGDRFWPNPDEF